MSVLNLELFVVRNTKGQYFRAKGFNGHGDSFIADINKARIYGRIGLARSVVTYFANSDPSYPILEILKLKIAGFEVLNEGERVKKSMEKKQRAEASRQAHNAAEALKHAEKALEEAKQKLAKLKK